LPIVAIFCLLKILYRRVFKKDTRVLANLNVGNWERYTALVLGILGLIGIFVGVIFVPLIFLPGPALYFMIKHHATQKREEHLTNLALATSQKEVV